MSNPLEFFNINNPDQGLRRNLAPGMITRIFVGEKVMLSLVEMAPNAVGSIHSHKEEQWGLILEGTGIRIQDGQEIPVRAGDFWCTPGGTSHGFEAGPDGARVLDIFSPPREDYKKEGAGFR